MLLSGFIVGAAISERSFNGVDSSTQGIVMSGLAPLRKANLVGIVVVIVAAYCLPSYGWALLLGYFTVSSILAVRKILQLEIPQSVRNGQVAAVLSTLIGIAAGVLAIQLG